MDDKVQIHVIFHGNVQGIGFRYTVQQLAQRIGSLNGKVRNMADGSVELYAQGSKVFLEMLISTIQNEFNGYITSTDVHFGPIEQAIEGFHIVR